MPLSEEESRTLRLFCPFQRAQHPDTPCAIITVELGSPSILSVQCDHCSGRLNALPVLHTDDQSPDTQSPMHAVFGHCAKFKVEFRYSVPRSEIYSTI